MATYKLTMSACWKLIALGLNASGGCVYLQPPTAYSKMDAYSAGGAEIP